MQEINLLLLSEELKFQNPDIELISILDTIISKDYIFLANCENQPTLKMKIVKINNEYKLIFSGE